MPALRFRIRTFMIATLAVASLLVMLRLSAQSDGVFGAIMTVGLLWPAVVAFLVVCVYVWSDR
jgi:hypothetical protein